MFKRVIIVLGAVVLIAASLVVAWFASAPAKNTNSSAHAARVVSTYETVHAVLLASGNYYQVYGIASVSSSDVGISENANISASKTRIWLVPDSLKCIVFGKGTINWCGVASGNGTFTIDSGLNYQWTDNFGTLHKFYLRYDISANRTCVTRGDFNGYYGAICGGLCHLRLDVPRAPHGLAIPLRRDCRAKPGHAPHGLAIPRLPCPASPCRALP
jgi:hypothetical protein